MDRNTRTTSWSRIVVAGGGSHKGSRPADGDTTDTGDGVAGDGSHRGSGPADGDTGGGVLRGTIIQ